MDPIADLLTILRNATKVKIKKVYTSSSKIKLSILKILEKDGYIENLKKMGKSPKFKLRFDIVYKDGISKLEILKRVSKPSRRLYIKAKNIKGRTSGYYIISTSKGVLKDREARFKKSGGEILCYIR